MDRARQPQLTVPTGMRSRGLTSQSLKASSTSAPCCCPRRSLCEALCVHGGAVVPRTPGCKLAPEQSWHLRPQPCRGIRIVTTARLSLLCVCGPGQPGHPNRGPGGGCRVLPVACTQLATSGSFPRSQPRCGKRHGHFGSSLAVRNWAQAASEPGSCRKPGPDTAAQQMPQTNEDEGLDLTPQIHFWKY